MQEPGQSDHDACAAAAHWAVVDPPSNLDVLAWRSIRISQVAQAECTLRICPGGRPPDRSDHTSTPELDILGQQVCSGRCPPVGAGGPDERPPSTASSPSGPVPRIMAHVSLRICDPSDSLSAAVCDDRRPQVAGVFREVEPSRAAAPLTGRLTLRPRRLPTSLATRTYRLVIGQRRLRRVRPAVVTLGTCTWPMGSGRCWITQRGLLGGRFALMPAATAKSDAETAVRRYLLYLEDPGRLRDEAEVQQKTRAVRATTWQWTRSTSSRHSRRSSG
jgi:hypothetical protein